MGVTYVDPLGPYIQGAVDNISRGIASGLQARQARDQGLLKILEGVSSMSLKDQNEFATMISSSQQGREAFKRLTGMDIDDLAPARTQIDTTDPSKPIPTDPGALAAAAQAGTLPTATRRTFTSSEPESVVAAREERALKTEATKAGIDATRAGTKLTGVQTTAAELANTGKTPEQQRALAKDMTAFKADWNVKDDELQAYMLDPQNTPFPPSAKPRNKEIEAMAEVLGSTAEAYKAARLNIRLGLEGKAATADLQRAQAENLRKQMSQMELEMDLLRKGINPKTGKPIAGGLDDETARQLLKDTRERIASAHEELAAVNFKSVARGNVGTDKTKGAGGRGTPAFGLGGYSTFLIDWNAPEAAEQRRKALAADPGLAEILASTPSYGYTAEGKPRMILAAAKAAYIDAGGDPNTLPADTELLKQLKIMVKGNVPGQTVPMSFDNDMTGTGPLNYLSTKLGGLSSLIYNNKKMLGQMPEDVVQSPTTAPASAPSATDGPMMQRIKEFDSLVNDKGQKLGVR